MTDLEKELLEALDGLFPALSECKILFEEVAHSSCNGDCCYEYHHRCRDCGEIFYDRFSSMRHEYHEEECRVAKALLAIEKAKGKS